MQTLQRGRRISCIKMTEQQWRPGYALLLVSLGFVYGCAIVALTIVLGGGGHGWCTPAQVSILGVALVPAFGIALASARKDRRAILWGLTTVMIFADLALVQGTESEGWTYFERAWSRVAGHVVVWAIMWFAWQFAVLGILIRDIAASWRK
jgi:hypothetical protein